MTRDRPSFSSRRFVGSRAGGTGKEKEMSGGYGALRLWATVLVVVGVGGVIFVGIGVIFAMIESPTFLQAMAFLLIGAPLAVLFASWPIALGQGLRALADVAEYVRDQQGFPAQRLSEGEHAPRA
jgi:hypothetical protein